MKTGLTLLAFCIAFSTPSQINLPGGQRLPDINVPGLEKLFKEDPPLTTSLDDMIMPLPFLDDWDPKNYQQLTMDDLAPDGTWKLNPGYYEMHIQTYCAHAGTYGPSRGMGYVTGFYKGKQAKLLQDIMKRSVKFRDLPQKDIQELVWAILAKAKPKNLQGGAKKAAELLLTKQEMDKLNGSGLDFLENRIMNQLMSKFDAALRPLYEAENKMRGMLYKANQPFEELERIAVLIPRDDMPSTIPKGRWNLNPNGYAVRFFPKGYSQTVMQVVVPHKFQITRDDKGRIIKLEGPPGYISQVEYDDNEPAIPCPEDPKLIAYKFKRILLIAPNPNDPSQPLNAEFKDTGWTFVMSKTEHQYNLFELLAMNPSRDVFSVITTPQGGWFSRWRQRYDDYKAAREPYDRLESYRTSYDRFGRYGSGRWSSDEFFDSGHYRDGIEAATLGSPADRLDWIADHHMRQNEALLHAITVLDTLPTGVDPSEDVVVPGHRGSQRLLPSARTY
jgi:hypothetical protein